MRRPLSLTVLLWLYAFWSAAAVLVLAAAALGTGEVAMDGAAVERRAVLERTLPVFLPLALAFAGGALAIGLRKAWARPALLLPFALAALLPALVAAPTDADPGRELIRGTATMALPTLLLGWYLYWRPRTVAYFEALRDAAEPCGDP